MCFILFSAHNIVSWHKYGGKHQKNAEWSEDRKSEKRVFMLSKAKLKKNWEKLKIRALKFITELLHCILSPIWGSCPPPSTSAFPSPNRLTQLNYDT